MKVLLQGKWIFKSLAMQHQKSWEQLFRPDIHFGPQCLMEIIDLMLRLDFKI